MNVGLIGGGRIGKIHARNIAYHVPHAHIARIVDIAPKPVKEWAAELGITEVSADTRDILGDPAIDAVIICSSTATHADLVVAAAEKGKHVFCEKPLDLTPQGARRAIAAAEKAGVNLQIGFNRRFDHNFARIGELVKAGAVGQPHIVRITSRDPAPPPPEYVKVSGGIFLDMTIHDFDMARFLSGAEVTEVYARGAVLVDPAIGAAGDVDTAIVTLTFDNGCLGVIDNSRCAAYGYDQRVEVFGSRGSASCSNDTATSVALATKESVTGDKPLYFFLERYRQAFIDEMTAFVDAVRNATPVPVRGEDGLQALLIALAAGMSLKEGRPVRLDEIRGVKA
jgi:myo-inositol 2-dehydrogenase/D-chiro-inositol 1-dehydrogenase